MNSGRFQPAFSPNLDSADKEIRAVSKLLLNVEQTLGNRIRKTQRNTALRLSRSRGSVCSRILRLSV